MDFSTILTKAKIGIDTVTKGMTADVLRERIAFLGEQLEILRIAHESTEKELASIKSENKKLTDEVASYRTGNEFVYYNSAAFKKNASGSYGDCVYCPTCLKITGSGFHDFPYQCSACGWMSSFNQEDLQFVLDNIPE